MKPNRSKRMRGRINTSSTLGNGMAFEGHLMA